MNRVKDYYDTAIEYLSLPISARFLIATHFKLVGARQLAYADREKMDTMVFEGVAKNNLLPAFKKFVTHFKKSRSHEYYLN